jgi:hypothetical protein
MSNLLINIKDEKDKQTALFIDKVQPRNKSEAYLIANKYDLKHPLREAITRFPEDSSKIVEMFKEMLYKRQEFLNLLAEYL